MRVLHCSTWSRAQSSKHERKSVRLECKRLRPYFRGIGERLGESIISGQFTTVRLYTDRADCLRLVCRAHFCDLTKIRIGYIFIYIGCRDERDRMGNMNTTAGVQNLFLIESGPLGYTCPPVFSLLFTGGR